MTRKRFGRCFRNRFDIPRAPRQGVNMRNETRPLTRETLAALLDVSPAHLCIFESQLGLDRARAEHPGSLPLYDPRKVEKILNAPAAFAIRGH